MARIQNVMRAYQKALREARVKRDTKRLEDERKQVLTQVDAILKDIGKLDLDQAP